MESKANFFVKNSTYMQSYMDSFFYMRARAPRELSKAIRWSMSREMLTVRLLNTQHKMRANKKEREIERQRERE